MLTFFVPADPSPEVNPGYLQIIFFKKPQNSELITGF
jgi:hypothetical protein